jgi:hypothetical protein
MMAHVIASISEVPGSKSAIKPCIPDVFDSTDPRNLETFVFQCTMYFSACKGNFRDDQTRVTFALSYLRGDPLDWFQTELTDSITDLVATLDQRYWERQSEINISRKSSSTHTSASTSSAYDLPTLDTFPFPSHSLPASDKLAENPENIGDHGPELPHSGTSVPQFAYIADFLGPDGKLKPGECKRRFDNGLCLRKDKVYKIWYNESRPCRIHVGALWKVLEC